MPEVRVGVDEARNHGRSGQVHHLARPPGPAPRGPTAHDPVVADDDVGVLDDLVALHRDRAHAAEHERALRNVALAGDVDPALVGLDTAPEVLRAVSARAAAESGCRQRALPNPPRTAPARDRSSRTRCRSPSGPCGCRRSRTGIRRRCRSAAGRAPRCCRVTRPKPWEPFRRRGAPRPSRAPCRPGPAPGFRSAPSHTADAGGGLPVAPGCCAPVTLR